MELRKPSPAFIEVAKVWHKNEELNRLTGFGRGRAGATRARLALDQVLKPGSPPFYAVWHEDEPVGYVALTDVDSTNKTAQIHLTIAPVHQGQGLGQEALRAATDQAFDEGLYRLEFKPLASNQAAIECADRAGYKLEARCKFAVWTDSGPKTVAQMRAVKPEWT